MMIKIKFFNCFLLSLILTANAFANPEINTDHECKDFSKKMDVFLGEVESNKKNWFNNYKNISSQFPNSQAVMAKIVMLYDRTNALVNDLEGYLKLIESNPGDGSSISIIEKKILFSLEADPEVYAHKTDAETLKAINEDWFLWLDDLKDRAIDWVLLQADIYYRDTFKSLFSTAEALRKEINELDHNVDSVEQGVLKIDQNNLSQCLTLVECYIKRAKDYIKNRFEGDMAADDELFVNKVETIDVSESSEEAVVETEELISANKDEEEVIITVQVNNKEDSKKPSKPSKPSKDTANKNNNPKKEKPSKPSKDTKDTTNKNDDDNKENNILQISSNNGKSFGLLNFQLTKKHNFSNENSYFFKVVVNTKKNEVINTSAFSLPATIEEVEKLESKSNGDRFQVIQVAATLPYLVELNFRKTMTSDGYKYVVSIANIKLKFNLI